MSYEFVEEPMVGASIKVIGVGGGGGNALNGIAAAGIQGNVEYIAVNTDIQALKKSQADRQIQIGAKLTHGLGAGAKPEIGEASAQESQDEIAEAIKDADMVFITAGMGGGTGTGAAPVVAEIAQSLEKLTIGVVTKPFKFEGVKKMQRAESGIEQLVKHVDALIVIPNQNLITSDMRLTMKQSYQIADEVLKTDVIAIAEIITRHDEINVDFADVTTILKGAGRAHIAIGHGEGKDKVQDIAERVYVDDAIKWYISSIVVASRRAGQIQGLELGRYVRIGASPRASIAFLKMAKATALIQGRTYVTPEDVKQVSHQVLRHRIGLNYSAVADNVPVEAVIDGLVNSVKAP